MKREGTIKLLCMVITLVSLLVGSVACTGTNRTPPATSVLPTPSDIVIVQDSSFDPSSTVITQGNGITWTNRDQNTYFINDDNQYFAFNLPAGGSFKITFTQSGVYNYHCATHPSMQGTIIVSTGNACEVSGNLAPGFVDVVNKVRPSVVAVSSELTTDDISGRPVPQKLAGTGWIINEDGLIVTNSHVVEGARNVTVTLNDGQVYAAKSVRADPVDDLAVIDIGVSHLQAARIGVSSSARAGDQVIALGNTLGEGITATQGIISDTDSTFTVEDQETLYHALQTTTPIDYGNSGGPLINGNGEVIGITTGAELNRMGTVLVGYAIASDIAEPIIQQLARDGSVAHAWLGVTTSSVSQFPSMGFKLSVDEGALVTDVATDSPAEKGGLTPGDIIVSFDDKTVSSSDDLVKLVRSKQIGQEVKIGYWRDNNSEIVIVTLT